MSPSNASNNFGLIIAYLLPGFIILAGIAPFAPVVSAWLHPATYSEASLGPPVYALLAATTLGMFASCFRWILIDHLLHWTGITPPQWNDSELTTRLAGFSYLVENTYRYYQFVSNSLVAIIAAYAINRVAGTTVHLSLITDTGVLVLCVALFAAGRDALSKYYTRTAQLLAAK